MKHPTNEGGSWASECFGSMLSRKAASILGTIPGGLRMKDCESRKSSKNRKTICGESMWQSSTILRRRN